MHSADTINEIIFRAIDEINLQSEEGNKIERKAETSLYGKNSRLDSLGLVNLIVEVEQKFHDELGESIDLTDEKALSQNSSPFLTVKTLSEYISVLLKEKQK
jgi:acyl carrier protein